MAHPPGRSQGNVCKIFQCITEYIIKENNVSKQTKLQKYGGENKKRTFTEESSISKAPEERSHPGHLPFLIEDPHSRDKRPGQAL